MSLRATSARRGTNSLDFPAAPPLIASWSCGVLTHANRFRNCETWLSIARFGMSASCGICRAIATFYLSLWRRRARRRNTSTPTDFWAQSFANGRARTRRSRIRKTVKTCFIIGREISPCICSCAVGGRSRSRSRLTSAGSFAAIKLRTSDRSANYAARSLRGRSVESASRRSSPKATSPHLRLPAAPRSEVKTPHETLPILVRIGRRGAVGAGAWFWRRGQGAGPSSETCRRSSTGRAPKLQGVQRWQVL